MLRCGPIEPCSNVLADADRDMAVSYLRLDPNLIIQTVEVLSQRIRERFPAANLNGVCEALVDVTRRAQVRSDQISQPMFLLRVLTVLFVVGVVSLFVVILRMFRLEDNKIGLEDLLSMSDAGFQTLVVIGATLLFLTTLEARVKRRRCLQAIHELRSIAHIIDMHQLTKDPDRLLMAGPDTKSSPQRTMSAFELTRYLDYCIEMLSLAGKVAALYIQHFEDPEAVSAVNDLEDLTSGLSRKIWQKIMVLPSASPGAVHSSPPVQESAPAGGHTNRTPLEDGARPVHPGQETLGTCAPRIDRHDP